MIALALNKTFANEPRFPFFTDRTHYKDKATALTIKNNVIQTQFMGASVRKYDYKTLIYTTGSPTNDYE